MPIVSLITAAASALGGFISTSFTWTAFAGWAASAAASIGLSSWLQKRQQKKAEAAAREIDTRRTQTFSSGPAQYPIGRTATGGVVVFWAEDWNVKGTERFNPINGGADDAHMVIALGEGACDKIEGVFIGDDFFPVKFSDDAKTIYQRREQRDGDTDRILDGLPIDLDPGTGAWFDVAANRWRKTNSPNAEFLNEDDDDEKEEVRRAALSGAISIFPYLDASGSPDNYRSLREYTDDRNNSLIHGKPTPFADEWTEDHKMSGVAGVHIRLRQWTKHKIGNRVFRGGVPQIGFLMRGIRITHPDPSSSTGDITQWTDNAAAVRYWWHTQRLGVDKNAIDRDSFVRAYNICNESIIPTKPTEWPGLSEEPEWASDDSIWGFKKYSINGVLFANDEPYDIERDFDMQWQGVSVEDGGKFYYFPGTDSTEADTITIDGSDSTELVSMGVAPSMNERFNSATITIDQSSYHNWGSFTLQEVVDQEKTDEVDGGVALPADIGSVRWTNNPAQAYMLAIIALRRYRNSMTYRMRLPLGDSSNIVKYLELTPGIIYNLNIAEEGITARRVVLIEKTITDVGDVECLFMDSPIGLYSPTYQLPDIPSPPRYTPTKNGSRPITPTGLRVDTIARTSSDGSVHFQITATVDANPLRVRFRLTVGDLVIDQEVNESTYTFDVNVPRRQMEIAAFHVDSTGMESIPSRLIFTPDYRHIVMPTPRWNQVQHFGSNVVMKFEPEEFTAAVSGVEIRYTRLDINTTADIPILTEETWSVDGELLTTDSLQLVHGAIITANAVAPQSGRYNLYARYLSNVSGAEPVRGPISALKEITIDIPSGSLSPGDAGFTGTMYNLDPWKSKSGVTKGETLLLPSHTPASDVKYDLWNGNVRNSPITTEPRPAWPFGRCVGYGQSLDETKRNATTGLWDGDNATLYRTLPVDLGESKRVDVRAEVHSFAPGTARQSNISFTGTMSQQLWRRNTPVPAIPLPIATGGTGTISYSIEGLPAGLSFNGSTRIISGIPTPTSAEGNAIYRARDASNGEAVITFRWVINDQTGFTLPGTPNGVTVTPFVTSARVNWLEGLVSSYHRIEISTDNTNFTLAGYSYGNDFLIPNLTSSTTYYIRVRGENGRGASSWTTPAISFTTLAVVTAPTAPAGLTVVDAVEDTILLRWNALTNDHTFDIRWKLTTDTDFDDEDADGARYKTGLQISTVSVDGLVVNTSYDFEVRAENTAGASGWSSSVTGTTVANTTTGPAFVSIEHISGVRPHFKITTNEIAGETGTDITIQDTNQAPVYVRKYRPDGSSYWEVLPPYVATLYEPAGPGPFLVYNVAVGHSYRIGIRKTFAPTDGSNTGNLIRETNWVYRTVIFTSVPEKMGGISPQTNGIFAFHIAMQANVVSTATKYRVRYWKTGEPENVISQTISNPPATGRVRVNVTGLSQLTEYSFTIQAYNSEGWGLPSDPTTYTTIKYQTTPAIIGGLDIYPISGTEALAVWDKDDQALWYAINNGTGDDNGNVQYTIVRGDDAIDDVHIPDGKLAQKISNLVQGQTYTFRIRGENPSAPLGARNGEYTSFPSITMPPITAPSNRYVFLDVNPITLSTITGSRSIGFSIRGEVNSTLKLFQIRYREKQTQTTGYVDDWQLIPNAAVNTHSSGTRTFTGSFDPGYSRRIWDVEVRAYVSSAGSWGAGFSDWAQDGSGGSFINGQDSLSVITPSFDQIPETTNVDIKWEPYTEEFETPNGVANSSTKTENIYKVKINDISLPFKRGDYTNRRAGATPRYDGDGIYDASFEAKGGTSLIFGDDFMNAASTRTRLASIGIGTIRVPKVITDTPNAGPFYSQNGLKWGEFLLDVKLDQINNPIQVENGDSFNFISVGGYTNVDTQTTYYLASRYSPRLTYGSSTRRYFVYTNQNAARLATDLGVFELQGGTGAHATAVLSINGHEARPLQAGDVIEAEIDRTDPYQNNANGSPVTYTVKAASAIPKPINNTVRNIRHTTSGRDVIFTWDETEAIGVGYEYEVSVIEDIPGEPIPSEGGGDPATTRTAIEQDSESTTFTKTGGRNEHFTISIRQHRYGVFGPAATYVYAPPVANNTVGKVYGLVADPVGNNVRVRWGETDNADGYELSTSTDSGSTWSTPVLVAGNNTREYTFNAVGNTSFYIRIRGYKGSSSPYTYSLSYSMLSWRADTNPANNLVEDIRTLVAVARNGSVYLDWSEADNADHYRLEYMNNGSWTLYQDNIAYGHSQWQTDLSDASDWTFRIRGESPTLNNGYWTQIDYESEGLYAVPHPSAYVTSSYRNINVYWPAISGADSYEIQYKTSADTDWTTASNDLTASPYNITGLTEGTTYNIRVRAKDGSNPSAWSELTTSTLSCASFGHPSSLVLVPHSNRVVAQWAVQQGSAGYDHEWYVSQQPNSGFPSFPTKKTGGPGTSAVLHLDDIASPGTPIYVRFRVKGKFSGCPNTPWTDYETIAWEPYGIIASPDSFTAVELGGTISVSVRLASSPVGGSVAVNISEQVTTGRASLSTTSMTFNQSNWNTPQTFQVSHVSDDNFSDDNGVIRLSPSGAGYSAANNKDISVEWEDQGRPDILSSVSEMEMLETESETSNITLKTKPTGDVTMRVLSTNSAGFTVSPSSLTFTPANWNNAQVITVRGIIDNDSIDDTGHVRLSTSGGGYDNIVKLIPVTIDDPKQSIITDQGTSMDVNENGTATLRVKIGKYPNGYASVTLVSGNVSAATLSPHILNFNNDNWNTYQSVTITGVSDLDGSDTYSNVTLTGGLAAQEADDVVVRVRCIDSDNKNLTMSSPSLSVPEGSSRNITARLTSAPNPNTTTVVTASVSDTSILSVNPTTRTFSPSNFSTAQNFVVSSIVDNQLTARTARVTFTSSGGGYTAFQNIPVSVANTSVASIVFDDYTTTDVGTNGSLGVKLSHRPSGNVTLICTTANSNGSISIVGNGVILFTTNNWNAYQTLTITGSGGGGTNVVGEVACSASGSEYTSVVGKKTISFNAVASGTKRIVASGFGFLEEGGDAKTLSIQVSPAAQYNVTATASPAGKVRLGWASRYTNASGSTTLLVTPLEDTDGRDDDVVITFNATRTSSLGGTNIPEYTYTIRVDDNDSSSVPKVVVSPESIGTIASPLNSANQVARTLQIRLSERPSSNVTATISVGVLPVTSYQYIVNTGIPTLTFTPSNWDVNQTFILSPTDTTRKFAATGRVDISASGGGFNSSTSQVGVPFTITSDAVQDPELYVQGNTPTTIQEGSSIDLDLRVRNQGGRAYNVTPSVVPAGAITFNSSSYSATNGRFPNVRLTAPQDANQTNETAQIRFTASRGSSGNYALPRALNFGLNIVDDDIRRITSSVSELSLSEWQTRTISVAPLAAPTGNVTITPSWVGSVPDASFAPSSLTFTTSNYSTAQSVSITANPSTINTTRTRVLRLTASGGGYNNVTLDVNVRIENGTMFTARASNRSTFTGIKTGTAEFVMWGPPPAGETWQVLLREVDGSTTKYHAGVALTNSSVVSPTVYGNGTNYTIDIDSDLYFGMYKTTGTPLTRGSEVSSVPSGWGLFLETQLLPASGASGNAGGSHGENSESAGALAQSEVASSTGQEPASIELDSSGYEYIPPVVVNPEVRPYFDGTIDMQIWRTGELIDVITLPNARGGAGPYDVSVVGLPEGLVFNAITGEIFGTPTQVAPQMGYATIRLTDANGNYDQREMNWHITGGVPSSWSDFDGGIGQINNPFRMQCSTKGNIRPFYYIPGGTNAKAIADDAPGARYRVMWMQCPTTYPHTCRLVGADAPDYDLVIKVGDDFYFSDTTDHTEFLKVEGHDNGAVIGVYRYEETTTSSGVNNTGDPLTIEWVPTVIDTPESAVGGVNGASETQGGSVVNNEAGSNQAVVPGNDTTDIYVLHRNSTTGAWTRIATPISSGWNDVGVNARQICFEFHFKTWDNRAIRNINASYRDR